MHVAAIIALCLAAAPVALGCGVPDRSYPPTVVIQGGKIAGLKQGIHGGEAAALHSWPWMVSLGNCGAALVNQQWLVTAAHCVADNTGKVFDGDRQVGLGTNSRSTTGGVPVERVVVHPQYTGACKGTGYDIALMRLAYPVQFTDKVQPICLPQKSDDFKTQGENIITAGWGDMTEAGQSAYTMQQAVLVTSLDDCQRTYIARGHANKDTEFCAWGGPNTQITVCPGDSGSPQVAYRGGKYVLAGVASCGMCESRTNPGIFTHAPDYVDWINEHTGDVDGGPARDVHAVSTCKDTAALCSMDKYVKVCDTDRDIKRLCPRACGTCQPDWWEKF